MAASSKQCLLHRCSFRSHFPHSFVEGCVFTLPLCIMGHRHLLPLAQIAATPLGHRHLKARQASLSDRYSKEAASSWIPPPLSPYEICEQFPTLWGSWPVAWGGAGHSAFGKGRGRGWEHGCFLKQNKAKQRGLFQNSETGKKNNFHSFHQPDRTDFSGRCQQSGLWQECVLSKMTANPYL